ncbi:MAG: hypothetical protein JWN86_1984 [Planctomycetota bacterium]|nr:hypothetical protein [Planctomycetota bacterium]
MGAVRSYPPCSERSDPVSPPEEYRDMPIEVTCDQCQAHYNLKDEHAGKKLRCKQCGNILVAPELDDFDAEAPRVDRGYHPAFARDKFLVNQKRMAISEKYYVFDEHQNPILYIERPAYFFRQLGALFAGIFTAIIVCLGAVMLGISMGDARGGGNSTMAGAVIVIGLILGIVLAIVVIIWLIPKRHISVYTDDTKKHLLLNIFQDRKVNIIRSSYTVDDPTHGHLGRFEKNYLYNIFRRRWYVYGSDGQLHMLAMEDSLIMSLLRRLLPPIIAVFIARTNFVVQRHGDTATLGEFNRRFTLFDKYVMDMSADRDHVLDRRMAIALGVLLDTGERR